MSRHLGILLTLVFSLTSLKTHAQDMHDYDVGFLKGLGLATAMLSEYSSGRGDADYHCATYGFRKSVSTQIAAALESELSSLHNPWLKTSLTELAKDIRSASPSGRGDATYWVAMLERQRGQLKRVIERSEGLAAQMVPDATVTSAREVGFMKGLRVGVQSMVDASSVRGDIQYFIRLFELQREIGKIVAKKLETESKHVPNPFLGLLLRELAKDIRAAPQDGKGDLEYWAGDIRLYQRRMLKRVGEKFDAFTALAASAAPACDRRLGSEDAGLPKLSLKDI